MKTWYLSKTLWLNAIAVLVLLFQTRFGFVIDPETQTGLLAFINIILRVITKAPLDWSTPAVSGGNPEGGFIRLQLLIVSLLIGACLLFAGCASTRTAGTATDTPQVIAGKSLLAVKSTIVVAATSADSLCKSGTLAPDKCSRIKTAYAAAQPAYDAAVDAYLLMSVQGGDSAAFGAALIRVQNLAANLLLISDPLGPKGGDR